MSRTLTGASPILYLKRVPLLSMRTLCVIDGSTEIYPGWPELRRSLLSKEVALEIYLLP